MCIRDSIKGVYIHDTFAEAFALYGTRFIITAANRKWALQAAQSVTGFATSIIGCGCEAGIEGEVSATPDDRPGVAVLLFATSFQELEKQFLARLGQCVMTCPTTACYNGLASDGQLQVGGKLRYFGDGWQASKAVSYTHLDVYKRQP